MSPDVGISLGRKEKHFVLMNAKTDDGQEKRCWYRSQSGFHRCGFSLSLEGRLQFKNADRAEVSEEMGTTLGTSHSLVKPPECKAEGTW